MLRRGSLGLRRKAELDEQGHDGIAIQDARHLAVLRGDNLAERKVNRLAGCRKRAVGRGDRSDVGPPESANRYPLGIGSELLLSLDAAIVAPRIAEGPRKPQISAGPW